MSISVKRILSKKNPTGKEVGKVMLLYAKNDLENKKKKNYKPLFSAEEFRNLRARLSTDEDKSQYEIYEQIYLMLVNSHYFLEAQKQQFYHGYYRAFNAIMEAAKAELFFWTANQMKVTMNEDLKTSFLMGIDHMMLHPEEVETVQNSLEILVKPALKKIYAYNAVVEILLSVYDVEFLTVAKHDTSKYESLISTYNIKLRMLEECISEETERYKIDFARKNFNPITIDDFVPSEDIMDSLEQKFDELGYSEKAAILINKYNSLIDYVLKNERVD